MSTFSIMDKTGGRPTTARIEPGLTLAQHLYMAGAFRSRPLCSGTGRCGLCRVRFLSDPPEPGPLERELVAPERLDQGWRLACRRAPVPGSRVEAALASKDAEPSPLPSPCPGNGLSSAPGASAPASLGIDLGTTSVQWRFDGAERSLSGSFPNPQLGAGCEVMSRLALARVPAGAARLRRDISRAVRRVLSGLPCLPGTVCLAGNTAMTYLALGLEVSGLAAAPYRLGWPGGGRAVLDEGLPEVYIPPLVAPFVGGDVSAGLAALEFSDQPPGPPYLLADLGTNGEFALVLPDGRVLVASVPMGPALEGVGMARGMLAGPGAAVAFRVSPAGLSPVAFDGDQAGIRGVSGTGYVSLLAKLRALGLLSETGRFARLAESPLANRVLAGLREGEGGPRLDAGGIPLHASDVEALLKVKAAFTTAVAILLAEAGMDWSGLSSVLLAGALGEHVLASDLETLGFFPPGGAAKVVSLGNTSLRGACLASAREDVRAWLAGLLARTSLVDVVGVPGFQKMYLDSMRFLHAG